MPAWPECRAGQIVKLRRRVMVMTTLWRVALVITVVAVLSGCSGGGANFVRRAIEGADYLADQATVAALLIHWLPVVFPAAYREAPNDCQPTEPEYNQNPDGTWTVTYRRSDCAEAEWQISADWMTMEGVIRYPDGSEDRERVEGVFEPDGTMRFQITDQFASGATAQSVLVMPPPSNDPGAPTSIRQGWFALPGGRRMDFTLTAFAARRELMVDGHEGWHLRLAAPAQVFQDLPDISQPAAGALSGSGDRLTFVLESDGAADFWNILRVRTPDGIDGVFTLDRALRGRGTVRRDAEIVMTLVWNEDGTVRATYADGRRDVQQPSAAARDFLVDRWMWSLAEYGPSPR